MAPQRKAKATRRQTVKPHSCDALHEDADTISSAHAKDTTLDEGTVMEISPIFSTDSTSGKRKRIKHWKAMAAEEMDTPKKRKKPTRRKIESVEVCVATKHAKEDKQPILTACSNISKICTAERQRNKSKATATITSTKGPIKEVSPSIGGDSKEKENTLALHEDIAEKGYISVNKLNPFDHHWTIKVRVLRRSSIDSFQNQKGAGRRWRILLLDMEGVTVQAVIFNEVIDDLQDSLLQHSTYYISNGYVKNVNPAYANAHKKIELTLTRDTRVELSSEPIDLKCFCYNFISFSEMHLYTAQSAVVDIVGILTKVGELVQRRKKTTGEILIQRNITLSDKQSRSVVLALWGELATEEGELLEGLVENFPVLAISKVKVTEYVGVLSLSSVPFTTIQVDPTFVEAVQELKYRASDPQIMQQQIFKSLHQFNPNEYEMFDLSDLLSRALIDFKTKHCCFKATIVSFNNTYMPWYKACIVCTKRVNLHEGNYNCTSCGKSSTSCDTRYMLKIVVASGQTRAHVTLFEAAKDILEFNLEEVLPLPKQEQEARLQDCTKRLNGKSFVFYTLIDEASERNRSVGRIVATSVIKQHID